jgi:hypothetical protein
MAGRPRHANTINAIPEGPMPTAKAKWAAIAKWHAINDERRKGGYDEITGHEFMKHTGIKEIDILNAGSHKEYIEAVMSLAKGQSTLWFKDEIEHLQQSMKNMREAGEDKEYVKMAFELANMLKFKDTDFSGMEDSEAKTAVETVEEIMNLLNDPAVVSALKQEEGIVSQKVIPALISANFKSGAKAKIITSTRPGESVEGAIEARSDKLVDTVSEAGEGPVQ